MGRRQRKGIVLLNEHMLFAEEVLSTYERAELYDAIRAYSMEGKLPDLTVKRAEWRGIFRILKAAQDEVIRKYDETCERNRMRVNKRWNQNEGEDTGNTGNTGYTGNTENTKQNKTKQKETKQRCGGVDLSGHAVEGVTGVVWA